MQIGLTIHFNKLCIKRDFGVEYRFPFRYSKPNLAKK